MQGGLGAVGVRDEEELEDGAEGPWHPSPHVRGDHPGVERMNRHALGDPPRQRLGEEHVGELRACTRELERGRFADARVRAGDDALLPRHVLHGHPFEGPVSHDPSKRDVELSIRSRRYPGGNRRGSRSARSRTRGGNRTPELRSAVSTPWGGSLCRSSACSVGRTDRSPRALARSPERSSALGSGRPTGWSWCPTSADMARGTPRARSRGRERIAPREDAPTRREGAIGGTWGPAFGYGRRAL